MKPSQVASKLRQISVAIDNSKSPRGNLVAADLRRIVAELQPQDLQGEEQYVPTSPEDRAVMGDDPRFKEFVRGKLGLQPGDQIRYEDALKVIEGEGLTGQQAHDYALWCSEDFTEH